MTYREYAPCPELAPFVECYWTRVESRAGSAHRVLPDGCIDIVYDLASSNEGGMLVGTMTRPFLVESGPRSHFVAVRFRPGGAFPFFGTPMHELTDDQVPVVELWGENLRPTEDHLRELRCPEAQVRTLERELVAALPRLVELDPRVGRAIALVSASGREPNGVPRTDDPPTVQALGDRLGMSRQHLTRRFKVCVGIGPKQFARVMRLRRLVGAIHTDANPRWARAALDVGYYDQAHMISEFKRLTGLTPSRYAAGI